MRVHNIARILLVVWATLGAPITEARPVRDLPMASSCLQGSFIQFRDEHSQWTPGQWRDLFISLKRLGVTYIVVQWSQAGDRAFYPSTQFTPVKNPPLLTILRLAQRYGMQVMVGLSHDPDYWKQVAKDDKHTYLAQRQDIAMSTARELASLVKRFSSFAGWYISEEIDDVNWRTDEAATALVTYVHTLSAFLAQQTPFVRIAISGFVNQGTEPALLESFWMRLLEQSPALTTVFFQDSVGAGKLAINAVPAYYEAVVAATSRTKKTFVPIVETFSQTHGEPFTEGEFAAVPAPLGRLVQQIDMARRYSAFLIAFSLPEYMTPAGGKKAHQLYKKYLSAMKSHQLQCDSMHLSMPHRPGKE